MKFTIIPKSLFAIIMLFYFFLSVGLPPLTSYAAEGTGTALDPYQILYIEDLYEMQGNTEGKYWKLMRDLDFGESDSYLNSENTSFGDINEDTVTQGILLELTTGKGWNGGLFKGVLDGKFHSIHNLYQNEMAWPGLFEDIQNLSVVKNMGIIDAYINKTGGSAGVLAALITESTVSNVIVTGTIACSNTVADDQHHYNGGIIGATYGSNIEIYNSFSDVSISGNGYGYGGILGQNNSTYVTIHETVAAGNITSSQAAGKTGGIIGVNTVGSVNLANNIVSMDRLENLTTSPTINRITSYGATDSGANTTYTNNYANENMTGDGTTTLNATDAAPDNHDGAQLSFVNHTDQNFFAANLSTWDFTNTWKMTSDGPRLRDFDHNALGFDGIDDNVTIPDSAPLDVTSTMTVEAWVYINTLNQHAFFIDKCFTEMTGGFALSYELDDKLWFYLKETNDILDNGDHIQNVYISEEQMLGRWHHIAGTFDGTSSKLFLDGTLISEKAASGGGLDTNDNPLMIGSVRTNGYYVDGAVDEVRIWNIARSADQIRQNMYRELEGNEAGLVAYYDFNESVGTTLYDKTANNNNGTFSGAVWMESEAMKPVNITITDVTTTGLTASWTEGDSTDTFDLQIDDNTAFTSPINITANLDSNADSAIYSYNITGQNFAEITTYFYRMAVTNEGGISSYSDIHQFMVAPGNALYFDGLADGQNAKYVDLVSNPGFANLTALTIEAWVKPNSTKGWQEVFHRQSDTGGNNSITLAVANGTNLYTFINGGKTGATSIIASNVISIDAWNHIAYSWNSSDGSIVLYVNGENVTTGTGSTEPTSATGTGKAYIGTLSGTTEFFSGWIDELRIWNDVRTQTEIIDNMYKEAAANKAGLIAYYNFNFPSGDTVQEITDSGYNGTRYNMTNADVVDSDCFNTPPADIHLSSQSFAENQASGTEVAVITATNEEAGDTLTYSLTAGTGDTDNASFTITGDRLFSAEVFNYEVKNQYNIRLRVEDGTGHAYEEAFIITVADIVGEMEVIHLNSGYYNTMLSFDTGDNYAWGTNSNGMFGYFPDSAFSQTPLTIPNHTAFTKLSSYLGAYAIATKNDGTVWSWGQNNQGRLGSGQANKALDNPAPTQIPGLVNITATAASGETAYALSNDGDVYSWGYEHRGALGNGISGTDPNVVYTPTKLTGDLDTLNITDIEAAYLQGFALTDTGDVYSWGGQYYGLLGTGVAEGSAIATPTKISTLANIQKLDANYINVVALDSDGDLFAWGSQFGQAPPQEIAFFENITVVDAVLGQGFIVALDNTGKVYSVGDGTYGALGLGDTNSRTTPEQITALVGKVIDSIHTGSQHCFAVAETGEVYGWGNNDMGQLGDGTFTNQLTPILINSINSTDITDIITSGSNTFIIKNDTNVDVIGSNGTGMFADGLQPYNRVPGKAANIPQFDKISLAREHGAGLKSDGTVWTWGINIIGQLGDGTYVNKYTPIQVNGILSGKTIVDISAESNTTLAVDSTGQMYAWGSGSSNRLGNGSTSNSNIPVAVTMTNITGTIIKVAMGDLHAMALSNNGSVYVWGFDRYGCLGTTAVANDGQQPIPIPIDNSGFGTAIDIEAGVAGSFVVATDGTLWTTGYITGDEVYQMHDLPYKVKLMDGNTGTDDYATASDLAVVKQITFGYYNAAVLTEAGNVYTFGPNDNGSAGNGVDGMAQRAPYLVLSDVKLISSGMDFSIAVKNDDSIWAWGKNNLGQLGNGEVANSLTPVQLTLNRAPSDISMSQSSVDERLPQGTFIANFSTTDPDTGDSFTYEFTSGTGDTDNNAFTIDRYRLLVKDFINYDIQNTYSTRIRSTDSGGLYTDKAFTLTVNDVLNPFYTVTGTTRYWAGSGSVIPAAQSTEEGTTITLTVTPGSGSSISTVTGCGGSKINGPITGATTYTTGTITEDCTVTATFTLNTCTVTTNAPGAGSGGIISPESHTVNHGSSTTFTLTPDWGYTASVSGCGGSYTPGSTIYTTGALTGNCEVSVSFTPEIYTVTGLTTANGTISPVGAQPVNHGGTITFTVTPAPGYSINTVLGCRGTLNGNSYTTDTINGPCKVMAFFK